MLQLNAFFPYFGSKVRLATNYPLPRYQTVIEPFAGSAGYALRHYYLKVNLYDLNPIIVGIWDFLIKASSADIKALPLEEDKIQGLSDEKKNFIGFWFSRSQVAPQKKISKLGLTNKYPWAYWSEDIRERIAFQVCFIKHWRVALKSYSEIPNQTATWFIDPPYQSAGKKYPFGRDLNFDSLGTYSKTRQGQVIVCENGSASWLPFTFLYANKSINKKETNELVFIKDE